MADALDRATKVYVGFWTDWSKGSIWGLTWTLSPLQSTILTNSLALFVSVWGVQLWTIVRYILHQLGASERPELSTPHLKKQQVILRNAGSDLATAWLMLNLACTSRRSTGTPSRRSYTIGLFAIVYAVLFLGAGIFSNKAIKADSTNGGSAVLSRSHQCGVWNQTYYNIANGNYLTEEELGLFLQFTSKQRDEIQFSLQYAQDCYLSQKLSQPSTKNRSATCNTLKSPNLEWETREGSCPFDSQLCTDKTIILDTGDVDTHDDLGINANPSDRLRYRRITKCAVLNGTDYIRGWGGAVVNSSSPKPSQEPAYAYYGPSLYKNTEWTYSYSNFASFYDNFTTQVSMPYQLDAERAWALADPQWSLSDFDPIPELKQQNSDLTLLFLSFNGMYLSQVDDPWYSAHNEETLVNRLAFLEKRYTRDTAISTLGCTEQHSFCTSNDTCTGLLGFDQVQNVESFKSALTPHQNATFDRMIRAVAVSTLPHLVEYLSAITQPVLAMNETFSGSSGAVISRPLQDIQWKLELSYWHSIAMAQLQRTVAHWATGQIAPEPQSVQYLLPPSAEQDVWFCQNLIVPSIVYQSFSVMAIILIFISGTLVVIASLCMENLACLIRKCFSKSSIWDWNHDDMLGLEHLMNESLWKPRPPPKDDDCHSTYRQSDPRKSRDWEKIATTISIRETTSLAPPPEYHTVSPISCPMASLECGLEKGFEPPPRLARRSWTASGLQNHKSATSEIPVKRPDSVKGRRLAKLLSIPRVGPVVPYLTAQRETLREPKAIEYAGLGIHH